MLQKVVAAAWLILSASGAVVAQAPEYVTVGQQAVASSLEAYGQVEPIAALSVSFAEAGVVSGLRVLPGMHVRAGEMLGRLRGPEIEALLMRGQADVRSARAQLKASQNSLTIQRQQLAVQLSTRQVVHQAENAVAQAQTGLDNAQSHLRAVRQMMTLTALAAGTVLAVDAADGERVSAGQPVLTLEAANRLWLKASYYGADLSAIRPGMTGSFAPADGSTAVPVRVASVFGSLTADGTESVAMVPVRPGARWLNGEFGTVTLSATRRMLVAVPTGALILDRGRWWVLVHTAGGDHPQAVVPGPSRGWETFLESGLAAGAQVVTENAYLLFHNQVARHYQMPD